MGEKSTLVDFFSIECRKVCCRLPLWSCSYSTAIHLTYFMLHMQSTLICRVNKNYPLDWLDFVNLVLKSVIILYTIDSLQNRQLEYFETMWNSFMTFYFKRHDAKKKCSYSILSNSRTVFSNSIYQQYKRCDSMK